MSVLWERTRERFRIDLENTDQRIQCTQEALQLLNELQIEKGVEFVRSWLYREGDIPLLFEYIKHYQRHIPLGFVREDGCLRIEATLAKNLFLRLKELSYNSHIEIATFIRTMGQLELLKYNE